MIISRFTEGSYITLEISYKRICIYTYVHQLMYIILYYIYELMYKLYSRTYCSPPAYMQKDISIITLQISLHKIEVNSELDKHISSDG